MMKKTILFLTAILCLSACVVSPRGLETKKFKITELQQILPEDYACACKPIRLGGKVISATALEKQTRLEILSLPVYSLSAKPQLDSISDGRFIAYVDGFIDPEVLKDRYITIGGVLKKQEKGKVDKANYNYPIVAVEHYRLWRLGTDYYRDYDDWELNWGWHRHWNYPPQIRYYLY
ncbi:Slp family lipoprotein [Rodentibacter caecimuris]|uniref:Starvation-inducible protein n=1 Tax=Rodentibacter caecimuris TaxID=1796644 RepID=A0ABX3KVH2_9PAST|nr:hypothetical protein BKG89_09685 [Rodentibacter heylii]